MLTSFEKDNLSQKLIRCQVVSKKNKAESLRFIELEHFKLWAYMMFHKHGMRIKDASLWLWVKERDFLERREIYSRFPEVEEVNRIELLLFDELNGFSHTVSRYALKEESHILEKVLLKHLASDLAAAANYEMKTLRGYCIKSGKHFDKMVLGLSDSDDRIWYREV